MTGRGKWALLIGANVLLWCVLGLCQGEASAQRAANGTPPFANSVEQRNEQVALLRDIKTLLQEQNALLTSGSVKVTVTLPQP